MIRIECSQIVYIADNQSQTLDVGRAYTNQTIVVYGGYSFKTVEDIFEKVFKKNKTFSNSECGRKREKERERDKKDKENKRDKKYIVSYYLKIEKNQFENNNNSLKASTLFHI
uniref:Uncharacterized protein n=1 Tax=Glossina morsitans morsitans TaxID=37546 RepID=A0A1B0G747_GLOMM